MMETLTVKVQHRIGDIVYLKTDIEQNERVVSGYYIQPNDILYELSCVDRASKHYHFEISIEKIIK